MNNPVSKRSSRLILQHWDTVELPELARLSSENVQRYAKAVGAFYCRLVGFPFHPDFSPQAQKLAMLDASFDGYDAVCVLDMDQFAVRGLKENVFDSVGYGFHQVQAHRRVCQLFPSLSSPTAPFLGGPIYKFTLAERQALRHELDFEDLDELKQLDCAAGGWDEGMMHRLAMRAGLPAVYLPETWAWSSYLPPRYAHFVHVRNRPIRDKLANYRALVERGVLE